MRRSTRQETYAEQAPDIELTRLESPIADSPANGLTWAYPEGGREGWMCLLGSSLIMFPSFGFQTSGKVIIALP